MSFLALILTIALLGLCVWLVTTYIPMPPIFQTVIQVLVVVTIILWLIGILTGSTPWPRLHFP